MADADKILLLKELNFYSSLLKKHEASKREIMLKTNNAQQTRMTQQPYKPRSFQSYKVVKNQCHSSSSNQKYSYQKPSHLSIAYTKKGNGQCSSRQNYKSKYALSKPQVPHANDFVLKRKNLNSDVSVANAKSASNSKSESIEIPCASLNESGKLPYNAKDVMKEIISLTELLKKKASNSPQRILNSKLDMKNVLYNKQACFKKDQNADFGSINLMPKTTSFSKTKSFVATQSELPDVINHANRVNSFMKSNVKSNPPQQKVFNLSKSVYKKNNVNQFPIANSITSLKNVKNRNISKNGFENNISRSTSRTVIFSDCKKISHDLPSSSKAGILHKKPSEIIMKLHTPKIIFSSQKNLKKSPHANKTKSPVFLKLKSCNTNKIQRIAKLKQTNTKYTKVNKHLTPPNKKMQVHYPIQYKSSLKKIKKKVNSNYTVINKTPTLSARKKINTNCTSVNKKNTNLSMDGDTFLEALNDSAVEKLEKNLLVISSELTTPYISRKSENSNSNVITPFLSKANSKSANKRAYSKKYKSRISKYKIINSSTSQKFSIKNMQTPHMLDPVRREKVILVRRLFKSKNAIINKNASPTSYSAKLIKSKYLSLNKRKSFSSQKYVYPAIPQLSKFKGSYSGTILHRRQKQFKNNGVSGYHSRLIRKANYGRQTYALTYKNNHRCVKKKMNNRFGHPSVVFIQGSRYAMNLNGKSLKRLPLRGHTAKNFQRSYFRTPENSVKTFPTSAHFASRALHLSINRILTASSKKKLSKVNSYCMFYNRFGRCNRGVKCTYIHDPSKIAVCTRFLRGTCKIDGCPFSHEIDPGKMAICSFFLVGQCDKENCLYRHEKLSPDAVLCKDFVQGYCCYGKECKKAHILICPKYMQGECDKGSSCAFPHPPQKAKKNVQEEVENEETKPAEVLLEKVLRYFQQAGDSQNKLDDDSPNLFVPKQRKLDPQPSFIPL